MHSTAVAGSCLLLLLGLSHVHCYGTNTLNQPYSRGQQGQQGHQYGSKAHYQYNMQGYGNNRFSQNTLLNGYKHNGFSQNNLQRGYGHNGFSQSSLQHGYGQNGLLQNNFQRQQFGQNRFSQNFQQRPGSNNFQQNQFQGFGQNQQGNKDDNPLTLQGWLKRLEYTAATPLSTGPLHQLTFAMGQNMEMGTDGSLVLEVPLVAAGKMGHSLLTSLLVNLFARIVSPA